MVIHSTHEYNYVHFVLLSKAKLKPAGKNITPSVRTIHEEPQYHSVRNFTTERRNHAILPRVASNLPQQQNRT